jgi:competence protein ComEC
MGAGIDAMVAIARTVATWTPDGGIVGRPPVAATLLIVAGGIWVCLWTRRARRPGWLLVALGIALSTTGEPPDLVVAGDGRRVLVRGADGYRLVGRPDDFETPIWLAAVGDPRRPDEPSLRDLTGCDREACILRRPPGERAKAPDQPAATVSCEPEACGRPSPRAQISPGPLWGRATAGGPADGPGRCEIGTCADATIRVISPSRPDGLFGRPDSVVAVIFRPEAFLDECGVADVVVASIPAPEWCRRVTTVIDVGDLADGGARTYRIDPRPSGALGVTLVEIGRAIPAVRRPFHVGAP